MIFRHPEAILASWRAMYTSAGGPVWCALQWPPPITDDILMEEMGDRLKQYYQDQSQIPRENLVEIRHEDLLSRPLETLTTIYDFLKIETSNEVLSNSQKPYSRNRHPSVSAEDRKKLRQLCDPLFANGWYEKSPRENSPSD